MSQHFTLQNRLFPNSLQFNLHVWGQMMSQIFKICQCEKIVVAFMGHVNLMAANVLMLLYNNNLFPTGQCVCNVNWLGDQCQIPIQCQELSKKQCRNEGILTQFTSLPNQTDQTCDPTKDCQCVGNWSGSTCSKCPFVCNNGGRQPSKCGCLCKKLEYFFFFSIFSHFSFLIVTARYAFWGQVF